MSSIDRYISEYQLFAVKTAQSTLEMCRVVHEAKNSLVKDEFSKFCNHIAQKPEDATIRKYLAIGEKYEQFISYADLLPNSWTSIYLITQIPADMFNALVATNSSMAHMTGKQIQKLIDGSKNSSIEVNESSTAAESTSTSSATEDAQVAFASTDTSASDDLSAIPDANVASDNADTTVDTFIDAAADASTQTSSSADDDAYAKKATDQIVDHVNKRILSNDIDDDDDQSAYEVIIRFSYRPSDDAINEVVKSLSSIREKYMLNFEIDTKTIEHV